MPGLVKVGYSSKDPEARASELNSTGVPHPYTVDYEILVEDPYKLEQKAHRALTEKKENKEWFRCTVEEAISAIKKVNEGNTISETYKTVEREKARLFHKEQMQKEVERAQIKKREREISQKLNEEEAKIKLKYDNLFSEKYPEISAWTYFFAGAFSVLLFVVLLIPIMDDSDALIVIVIGGWIFGQFIQHFLESWRKNSKGYKELEAKRDNEISAVRFPISYCKSCEGKMKYDRFSLLLNKNSGTYSCPHCGVFVESPKFRENL